MTTKKNYMSASLAKASALSDSKDLLADLHRLGDNGRAKLSLRFFKTGKGEYGEGDVFLGITTPDMRSISARYKTMTLSGIKFLLGRSEHEARTAALVILCGRAKKASLSEMESLSKFYLSNSSGINNWDLVDISAPNIVGKLCVMKNDFSLLKRLAKSDDLWEKRIGMVGSLAAIRVGKTEVAIRIAKILMSDSHDLIGKAVGWMLREAWKRDPSVVEKFLDENIGSMKRVSVRYAIERMDEEKRRGYLSK